jgi:hypothetical protein
MPAPSWTVPGAGGESSEGEFGFEDPSGWADIELF